MFVQSNTVAAIRSYFKEKLTEIFSDSEIKQILNHALKVRLGLCTAELMLANNERLSESDLLYFRSIVKRLQANEPMQYIFGDTEFAGIILKCDERALIPRPETEELVDWVASELSASNNIKLLDVCTGSGCIALALKNLFPELEVHALDFSAAALDLAAENAGVLSLNIDLHELNALTLRDQNTFSPESFDCWISNPPYIPETEKSRMHQNVLDFEPAMALFVVDEDPLLFYREIALAGLVFLKPNGKLFFELHENFADQTLALLQELGYQACEIKLDLQGKKRMLRGTKKEA